MKKFDPIWHARKLWLPAIIICIVGIVVVYFCLTSNCTYTASAVISYNGQNADGTPLNPDEILSGTVVAEALKNLDTVYSSDDLEKKISIEERGSAGGSGIPSGFEGNAQTDYEVSLTLKDDNCGLVLDAILSSYFDYYMNNHLNLSRPPKHIRSWEDGDSDYLEYAETLENFVTANRSYLEEAEGKWGSFRSSGTGYSFYDLKNEYLLLSNEVDKLYSMIIRYGVTKNREALISEYTYRINNNNILIEQGNSYISQLKNTLGLYPTVNPDDTGYSGTNAGANGLTGSAASSDLNVRGDQTAYDRLVDEYVSARNNVIDLEADNTFYQNILNAFQTSTGDLHAASLVEGQIDIIQSRLDELDPLLLAAFEENTRVVSANTIRVTSPIHVVSSLNRERILTITFVLLVILCGIGILVFGKVYESGNYAGIKTDLSNQKQEEAIFRKYKNLPLPVPFTFLVVYAENLDELRKTAEPDRVNQIVEILRNCIKESIGKNGFFVYNGVSQFNCYLMETDQTKAELLKQMMKTEMERYTDSYGLELQIEYGVNTWRNISTIDVLMNNVMQNLRSTASGEETSEDD